MNFVNTRRHFIPHTYYLKESYNPSLALIFYILVRA
jgi:hypothetical protein